MGGWCTQKSIPVLVAGEDFSFDIYLTQGNSRQPFDLSAATAIEGILPNADGTTYLEMSLVNSAIILVSGPGGHFQITGSAAQSALLAQNQATALDIRITIGGKLTIVTINNALNIVPPAYPQAP